MAIRTFIALVACFAIIWAMLSYNSQRNQPAEVSVIYPTMSDIYDINTLRGTVVEKSRHEIYSKAVATTAEVYAQVGQVVQKGQALLKLTPTAEFSSAIGGDVDQIIEQIGEQILTANPDEISEAVTAGVVRTVEMEQQVEDFYIFSPISGTVMDIVQVGEDVTALLSCAVVSDLTNLGVSVDVSEDMLSLVQNAYNFTIEVPALSEQSYKGTVEKIMPYAAQTSGLLTAGSTVSTEVLISISEQVNALYPGYSATVKLESNHQSDALLIPYEVINQDEQNREYVMLHQNGYAVKCYIETGRELADNVQVLSGLTLDSQIINEHQELSHGKRVTALENR